MTIFGPKKNVAFKVRLPLVTFGAGDWKTSPTLAAGDFKVAGDGGALGNLATLPTVAPAASAWVLFSLSAAEMNFDVVQVQAIDQTSPKEWEDTGCVIYTTAVDFTDSVRLGLTALPNAAAEAAGGLYTRGAGAGQIAQDANGRIDANAKAWNALATVALPLVPTVAGRSLDVSTTGEAGLDFDNLKAATGATTLTNITVPVVTTVGTLTTYTGNTVQTGDSFARLGAPALASVSADVAALPTANANADALLDRAAGVETGLTPRQAARLVAAAAAGASSGMTTTGGTATFKDAGGNNTTRIVSALDSAGNRTTQTNTP